MKRLILLPLAFAVAAALNAGAAGNSADAKANPALTELPAKTPSDPLQAEDAKKSKAKAKKTKKAPESATNKPEPYVLDGSKGPGTTASPGTAPRGDTSQGATSMTAPQPGRGGPLPPGVTDPPAPPMAPPGSGTTK